MTKPLRIACIGAWGHLDGILAEIDSLGDAARVQIIALAKALPDEDFSEYQKQFRCAKTAPVFNDHRRMLNDLRPDVAVISTRLDINALLAIEAADAGCHLVCEKPLAINHASLAQFAEAVTRNKVHCIAMLGNRMQPVLAAAAKAIADGAIGTPILVNARKSYKWGTRPNWFGSRDLYGGSIGWIGIHGLDFITTATGQNFTSVAAMQSNAAHPERPECEDNAALVLTLENGGHATLSIDFLRPTAAATHGNDWLRVVGSKGVIEADMVARKVCLLTTHDQPETALPLAPSAPFYQQFYDSLRRPSATPLPDMHKAFYLTHVALCARDAADQKRVVTIPPLVLPIAD